MITQETAVPMPAEAAGWQRRSSASRPLIVASVAVLLASALLSATLGAVAIPTATLVQILLAKVPFVGDWLAITPTWPASYEAVVLQIRLPRVVLAGTVGASLALAGATYQGMFRNPLADPYLIGVAAGAALGAVTAIILPLHPFLYRIGVVQWMAFGGALLTVLIVYLLARVGRTTPVTTLLLAGVALGAFAQSITSFLMYAHGDKLQVIFGWLLGGLVLSNWEQVTATLPYTILGSAVILACARLINVLQLDEEQAAQLGVDVERLKLVLVGAATLVTASAVAVSGLIGFVGLVVPHAVRLVWGSDYRRLLPLSLLAGSTFLIWADTLARTALRPTEIPVGVITAFCGAPFFLYLLRQRKQGVF